MIEAKPIRFFERKPSSMLKDGQLTDSFNRKLTYLRISVTDRCNMRCEYCRPDSSDYRAERHAEILRYEEIERIVKVAAKLGITKIRITGGEPLVRRDLPDLIAKISAVPGINDIAMTTNATLLAKYVPALAEAGLNRINVSLDSLNALRFRKLTGGELAPVLEGIKAAKEAGITPIKLNTVLLRGVNAGGETSGEQSEVAELIDFAAEHDATIRFIELMPMKQGMNWEEQYISIDEVLQREDVRARVDVDAPLKTGNTAARYLPLKSGKGEVGFIMPMSERFCEGCNRLRLTADGGLRSCLPDDDQLNLRDLMRRGGSDDEVQAMFERSALIKPEIGIYNFSADDKKRSMIQIGG